MGCFQSRGSDSSEFSSLSRPTNGNSPNNESNQNSTGLRYKESNAANGNDNKSNTGNQTDSIIELPKFSSDLIFSIEFLTRRPESKNHLPCGVITGSENGKLEFTLFPDKFVQSHSAASQSSDSPSPFPPSGSSFSSSEHTKTVQRIHFDRANNYLFSGSRDKLIKLWDLNNLNGNGLAAAVGSNEISSIRTFTGHSLLVTGLSLNSSNSNELCSGSRDYSIRWWDVETGDCKFYNEIQQNVITNICSLESNLFLQSSEDLAMRIWDSRDHRNPIQQWRDGNYFSLSCDSPNRMASNYPDDSVDSSSSTDSSPFVVSSHNGFNGDGCSVKIWDRRSIKENQPLKEFSFAEELKSGRVEGGDEAMDENGNYHTQAVNTIKFIDSQHFLTASKDSTIKIWDFQCCLATIVLSQEFSPLCLSVWHDGSNVWISSGSSSGFVSVWKMSKSNWKPILIARSIGK